MKASRSFGSRALVEVKDLAVSVCRNKPEAAICLILVSPRTDSQRRPYRSSTVEMSRQEAQILLAKLQRALDPTPCATPLLADLVRGLGIGIGSALAQGAVRPQERTTLAPQDAKSESPAGGAS